MNIKEFYTKALPAALPIAVALTPPGEPSGDEPTFAERIARTAHELAFALTWEWKGQLEFFDQIDQEHKNDPEHTPANRDLTRSEGESS